MDLTIQDYYEIVKSFCAFVEELVISEDRICFKHIQGLFSSMNLKAFYLSKNKKDDDYYRFYELINYINIVNNVFDGTQEVESYDVEEAITKFREFASQKSLILMMMRINVGSIF